MLVTDLNFANSVKYISTFDRLAVDTETTGLNPYKKDVIVGISVATPKLESYYFPFRHGSGENLSLDKMTILLNVLFKKQWTTWNGKFDLKFLRKEMFRIGQNAHPTLCEDCMLALHLLDENSPNLKLKDTGDRFAKFIGFEPGEASLEQAKMDAYMMTLGYGHGDMWKIEGGIVAPYAERDVILTEKLRSMFVGSLEKWNLYDLWQEANKYLMVVNAMEERGFLLDEQRINENIRTAISNADECMMNLRMASGVVNLNPNSAKYFKHYLNAELMIHYGTSITSTDVGNLESLMDVVDEESDLFKVIKNSIDYRRWSKVVGTYYKAFLDKQVGMVLHPNLNQTGTVTSRFSCSDPNLQAIPRKEEVFQPKNHVKEAFIARSGWWLVQMDYKMAEIYIGAWIAGANHMLEMLEQGIDVHAETARMMGGISRSIAKRMNFGIMYGIGADSLVIDIKDKTGITITVQQASEYIMQYREVHPEMHKMYSNLEKEARMNSFIRMITGRVRRYNGSERFGKDGQKPSPYHKASSNMVQGSVAEIMRIASTQIYEELNGRMYQILHVHDSILSEVREEDYDTIDRAAEIMCISHIGNIKLPVPMRVDIEVGTRWSDLKSYKEVKNAVKRGS